MRYATRALDTVLAPPYDVISPAERERLARDPANIVHLELPVDENGPDTRYDAAARRLARWLEDGVLATEAAPALYPYAQRFAHRGARFERRGVFGLVELGPPGPASRIYPHEFTLSGPREDRRRLLAATHANLSPIFLLYDDADGGVRRALAGAWDRAVGSAHTPWGTEETLGRLEGDAARAAAEALSNKDLVFADGHHRYESALAYADAVGAGPGDPRRYVLAVLVERSDPGLLVLATHRVIPAGRALAGAEWDRLLTEVFESTDLGAGEDAAEAAEAWLARAPDDRPALVTARGPRAALTGLLARPGAVDRLFASTDSPAPPMRALDVVALHALLERGWGLTPETVRDRAALTYTRDAREAVRAVAGGAEAAFLVRPTPVERVIRLAVAGHRLPQKTTYFEPKMTSGWLVHVHDREGLAARAAAGADSTGERR